MTQKLNEFEFELQVPNSNDASAVPDDASSVNSSAQIQDSVPKRISVYAKSIDSVSYDDSNPIAYFDLTFSVNIFDESFSKTYQVVKRIAIDREKLALEAGAGKEVSIVESKEPALLNKKRARILAGLE